MVVANAAQAFQRLRCHDTGDKVIWVLWAMRFDGLKAFGMRSKLTRYLNNLNIKIGTNN